MVASKMFVSVQRNTLTKQETPATPVNINKFNVSKWLGDASWNPIKSTSSKNYYYELHDSPCESNNGNRSIKDNLINSQRLYRGDSFSESKCASPDNDSFAMFTEDRPVPVRMNIVDKENIYNQSTYPMEKNTEKSTVRASDTENQVKCFHSKPKNHAVIQTTHSKVANPPKTSDLLNSQPSFFHAKTMHSHDQISIPELHKDDDKIIGQKVAKVNAGSFYLHAKHSECYKSHLYHVRKETPEERSEILPKLLPIQENATRQNKYRIWKTSIDPKSGQMYYYDLITRQTQWDKPLELVSKQEKRAIRLKDVSQRDFFANMEANILQSFQMGQIPGTSNCIPKNIEKNKSFSKTYLHNPNLVNTISSMDETNLLRELDKVKVCIRNAKLSQQVQQVDKRFVLLNKQVPNKTTRNKSISFEYSSTNKKLKDVAKPVLTKNSTCGTMYVGPTMSAPDIDATINVSINLIKFQIANFSSQISIFSPFVYSLLFGDGNYNSVYVLYIVNTYFDLQGRILVWKGLIMIVLSMTYSMTNYLTEDMAIMFISSRTLEILDADQYPQSVHIFWKNTWKETPSMRLELRP